MPVQSKEKDLEQLQQKVEDLQRHWLMMVAENQWHGVLGSGPAQAVDRQIFALAGLLAPWSLTGQRPTLRSEDGTSLHG